VKTLLLIIIMVTNTQIITASVYEHALVDISGKKTSLKEHKGKVLLIVNVASKCGFTRQYKGLEALYLKYKDRGLVICGFPCNQFGGQEPGSEKEIKEFCSINYGVTFPLYSKIRVKEPDQHPLYAELLGPDSAAKGKVRWNFAKILVGRDGQPISRFGSLTSPTSGKLQRAIEGALAQKQ
tara:strand:- start:7679 stop:8221 length:543 start_codon:yes stop_codon:yes gene_type:complete